MMGYSSFVSAAALVSLAGTCSAQLLFWDGECNNGLWLQACSGGRTNWSPNQIPTASDDVVIDEARVVVQAGTAEVRSILQTGSENLEIATNGTLVIGGQSLIARLGIGGIVVANAPVELSGEGGNGKRLFGTGPVVNRGDFTLYNQSQLGHTMVFENRGTLRARGGDIAPGGQLINKAGGTVLMEGNGSLGAVTGRGGFLINDGGEMMVNGVDIGMQTPVRQSAGTLKLAEAANWTLEGLEVTGGSIQIEEESVIRNRGFVIFDGGGPVTGVGTFRFDAGNFGDEIIRSDVSFGLKLDPFPFSVSGLVVDTDWLVFENGAVLTILENSVMEWARGTLSGEGSVANHGRISGAVRLNVDALNTGRWYFRNGGLSPTIGQDAVLENAGELSIPFGVAAGVPGGKILNRADLELSETLGSVVGVTLEQTAGMTRVIGPVRMEGSTHFSGGEILIDAGSGGNSSGELVFAGSSGTEHVFAGLDAIRENVVRPLCVFTGAVSTKYHVQSDLLIELAGSSTFGALGRFEVRNGDVLLDADLRSRCTDGLISGGVIRGSGSFVNERDLTLSGGNLQTTLRNDGRIVHQGFFLVSGEGQIVNTTFEGYDFESGSLSTVRPLLNQGTLRIHPLEPARFPITGDFTQESGGEIEVQIGGPLPGSGYDQLSVSGHVDLEGGLAVLMTNGWELALGDRYEVIVAGSVDGLFNSLMLPPPTNGVGFRVIYEADKVVLEVVKACYADCSTSSGYGTLDVFDFLCFQDAFTQGDMYADCDRSMTLDVFDFLCFQDSFMQGCR